MKGNFLFFALALVWAFGSIGGVLCLLLTGYWHIALGVAALLIFCKFLGRTSRNFVDNLGVSCQTVLLAGVNDSADAMLDLFTAQ